MLKWVISLFIAGMWVFYSLDSLDTPVGYPIYCIWDKAVMAGCFIAFFFPVPKRLEKWLYSCVAIALIRLVMEIVFQAGGWNINHRAVSVIIWSLMTTVFAYLIIIKKWR